MDQIWLNIASVKQEHSHRIVEEAAKKAVPAGKQRSVWEAVGL